MDLFSFSTLCIHDKNKHRLVLKSVNLKDAGDISFQCGDVKDSCKLTVKECMYLVLFF